MTQLFLESALIILILVTLLWILSVFIKDVSIVDLFWGTGFAVVNAWYFFNTGDFYLRNIILFALVSVWGLRLTIYLSIRNIGKGEDYRYQQFRKDYGPERYWWFSYFQVFLLQGSLIMIVSLPLLAGNFATNSNDLNVLDYIAIVFWIIGFTFEAGGDYQMAKFKSKAENKGKVMNTGFWKYTRHPNYFGDFAVWWSYALFCVAAGKYWYIIGSVIMTILLLKVSGVSLLERSLKDKKPGYQDYIKRTSAFIPWPPKKKL